MREWRWRWAAISAACPPAALAAQRAGMGHPVDAVVGFTLLAVGIVCGFTGLCRCEFWGYLASCLGLLVNGFFFTFWGALWLAGPFPQL